MKIHAEITIPDSLSADVDFFAQHYFKDNHYRRTRYILGAVKERVARDKARQERVKKAAR